ncbi:MAG TPA: hypothetical protein VFR09_02965 [Alphaproteobacteria bacterium]|nr:hypothetical protein [Alphaproteobacteria bacterium]
MKYLLPVFCLCLAFAHPAFAETVEEAEAECQSYPNVPVNITPRFDDPVYDYHHNLRDLQSLSHDPSHQVHGTHRGLTLGLTSYEPMMAFKVPMKGVKFSNGLACAHVEHVDVTVGYQNVVVYIPTEVPQGSCGFNEVMAHEQKHIAVNKRLLEKYLPIIQEKLEAYLKLNGVFREQNADYAAKLLQDKLQVIVNDVSSEMMNENQREQQLVDSPEEYRRVSATCNGQLTMTATQYYRTGK